MSRMLRVGMLGLGLVACSSAVAREPGDRYAASPRLEVGSRALDRTLLVGTLIEATIHDSLSWRRHMKSPALTATVSADVKNAHRWVVIPAGSQVGFTIGPGDATSVLGVTSLTVWGRMYPVRATVASMPAAVERVTGEVVMPPGRILFVLHEGFTAGRRETP